MERTEAAEPTKLEGPSEGEAHTILAKDAVKPLDGVQPVSRDPDTDPAARPADESDLKAKSSTVHPDVLDTPWPAQSSNESDSNK